MCYELRPITDHAMLVVDTRGAMRGFAAEREHLVSA